MFNHKIAIKWLLESVGTKTSSVVVDEARQFGLLEQPYVGYGRADSDLPRFDRGFHFDVSLKGVKNSLLEILERDNDVLQAGIQMVVKHRLIRPLSDRLFEDLRIGIEFYLDDGVENRLQEVKWVDYGDAKRIAYVSLTKFPGVDSVVARVGNRKYWPKRDP